MANFIRQLDWAMGCPDIWSNFLKRLKLFTYWYGMFSKDWHVFDAVISIKNIHIQPHICIEYPWKDAPGIGDSICLQGKEQGD